MLRSVATYAAFMEVGTMPLDTATLILLGLYLSIIIAAPFLLAQRTRWTTRWVPPVKRVFAWYVLSFEVVVTGGLLGLVETAFVYHKDVALLLSGVAFVLALLGMIGAYRCAKRLAALRLQYPAQR
jgi:hypothetical protein